MRKNEKTEKGKWFVVRHGVDTECRFDYATPLSLRSSLRPDFLFTGIKPSPIEGIKRREMVSKRTLGGDV